VYIAGLYGFQLKLQRFQHGVYIYLVENGGEKKVGKIFVSVDDLKKLKGKEVRLLHLFNIKIDSSGKKVKFTTEDNKEIPKINWVSSGVKCKVYMPSGEIVEGLCEKGVETLKKGKVLQFERYGFVKLDSVKKEVYEFWFTHK